MGLAQMSVALDGPMAWGKVISQGCASFGPCILGSSACYTRQGRRRGGPHVRVFPIAGCRVGRWGGSSHRRVPGSVGHGQDDARGQRLVEWARERYELGETAKEKCMVNPHCDRPSNHATAGQRTQLLWVHLHSELHSVPACPRTRHLYCTFHIRIGMQGTASSRRNQALRM